MSDQLRIPPDILAKAFHSLYRVNVPQPRAERAYRRWRKRLAAAPCKYGRDAIMAVQCNCEGCIEKLCFLYFDQVLKRFGVPI